MTPMLYPATFALPKVVATPVNSKALLHPRVYVIVKQQFKPDLSVNRDKTT